MPHDGEVEIERSRGGTAVFTAEQCDRLLAIERAVLRRVSLGMDRDGTLDELCRLIDEFIPGALATVMLLDERREHLRLTASPGVPAAVRSWLEGVRPGVGHGSCAAVAALRQRVFVVDTMTDPHWADVREEAARFGIRACWSVPIAIHGDAFTGTFAISQGRTAIPSQFEEHVLETAACLAGVAIECAAHRAELAKSVILSQQTRKLENLGQIAGGIAHDVNNLLTGIVGNTELVRRRLESSHPVLSLLERIEHAAARCATLCTRIHTFAGLAERRPEPIDLNALVEDTLELTRPSFPELVALDERFDQTLPPILADPVQMTQVVLNLVLNARDAIGDSRGSVRVTTGRCHDDDQTVFLEVRDDGTGMSADVRERLFDPFYSTKGPGRGLGMSVVHGIVKAHAGRILVSSQPGEGSTIRVELPVGTGSGAGSASPSPAATPATATEPDAASPRLSGSRVLVVDDEPLTRDLVAEFLRSIGIDTLLAANPREALELLETHRGAIDATLLDVSIPDLPGEQLFDRLHDLAPKMPIVVCSGLGDAELRERFQNREPFGFLLKPFRIDDFDRLMRGAIASGRS
jgi:signal transduction histidine kinase/CheY-like chemotaxis protein